MPWGEDGGARFAAKALELYGLPETTELKLISLSENATFLVRTQTDADPVGILRIYRPHYQTDVAKQSEIAWIGALRQSDIVKTPGVIHTQTGDSLGEVTVDGDRRTCVMFEFIAGQELADEGEQTFEQLGRLSAGLHLQVQRWEKPEPFERMRWGLNEILGNDAPWGDWREAPGITPEIAEVLEQTEARIRQRLNDYDLNEKNSNLVHCDLRAANVMRDATGDLWIIDFDDSGFSWFLWDLCSTTSFLEPTPEVDQFALAWLRGYNQVRPLTPRDVEAVPDLVMLRRLHLTAWMGTHPESFLVAEHGETFARETAEVAERYLAGDFISSVKQLM